MCIQFEDVVDWLQHFHTSFDFKFLFDHSNGHDMLRPDGLSVNKLRKYFGGVQPKMKDSVMLDDSYFGEYKKQLNIGDTHSKVFSIHDTGPFYLTPIERARQKYDKCLYKDKDVVLKRMS